MNLLTRLRGWLPTPQPAQRRYGGLRLDAHKTASNSAAIRRCPLPPVLSLPIAQRDDDGGQVIVKLGDRVQRNQPLTADPAARNAIVHAPCAGHISGLATRPIAGADGQPQPCIMLTPDSTAHDDHHGAAVPDGPDPLSQSPAAIARRIHAAGIVGLGGALFPTHTKLTAAGRRSVHTVIINGAECEPYISCDDRLMRERAAAVIDGARILIRALRADRGLLGVEDNKPEAFTALRDALRHRPCERLSLHRLPTGYPSGGERQIIQRLTGLTVPADGLPTDIGVVCFNVGTAAAVHQALRQNRPVTHRVVTVTGNGVAQPGNCDVPIGTPIAHVIAHAGGYTAAARRLFIGGPMMGWLAAADDLPITKGTNCLLVLNQPQPGIPTRACIRCGHCADVCPIHLLPQQLYRHVQAGDLTQLTRHRLHNCIECGACAYVCPSHIPLIDHFRDGKRALTQQRQRHEQAEYTRRRVVARDARLAREAAERQARLARKKARITGAAGP